MKDIPVYKMDYIKATDAGDAVGCHWFDFIFTEMCENDSFCCLDLSDYRVEEINEEIKWNENRFNEATVQKYKNELKLVEYLRSKGYRSSVQVWISW